jgi:zinc/manganese transport system permease protein/manganese/iron transport system permease protein
MALAAVIGSAAVCAGLLVSWHAATAAGATIAATAIAAAGVSWVLRAGIDTVRRRLVAPDLVPA